MKARSESILFLIVGSIAAISGAYDVLYNNYQESSVWVTAWNVFRLIAGLIGIILGLKGTLNNSRKII